MQFLTISAADSTQTPLSETLAAGVDHLRSISDDDDSSESLTGLKKELLEVFEATDVLLETIDFERFHDVVNVEELSTLVDIDHLADAIEQHDPDLAFDLSDLESVIDDRELLNSIDLLEFWKAKRVLDREVADVIGDVTLNGGGSHSKAGADVAEFVSSLGSEAPGVMVQQEATEKVKAVQNALLDAHAELERRLEINKSRLKNTAMRSAPRRSTAVSLLPNNSSLELSTVRSRVLHSNADPVSRIYGTRWSQIKRDESE